LTEKIHINRSDVLWNYAATFFKIASSILLLPLILRMMPSEKVGIWSIFMAISAFASLLDFGFNPSFTRNVSYIFSGVRTLKVTGVDVITGKEQDIDYGLLKGLISTMRWFYFRMALILLLLLVTIGTVYIYSILKKYQGIQLEVYISWGLLCLISTYNLFTLYYDALLQGRGLIKRSKQIIITGNLAYLILAAVLILMGKGLIAIVSAQAASVIIIRQLSYHSFFTNAIKEKLHAVHLPTVKEIFKAIYPNAFKLGITSFGSFLVQRSAIVIGSLYLPLSDIATYGVTMQIITLISALAGIYISTYYPKISQLRVIQDDLSVKSLYLKGLFFLFFTYFAGWSVLYFIGNWVFALIGSKTQLMSSGLLSLAVIVSLLETNLSTAGSILLTKNEVPFFKAAILSGLAIVLGLVASFRLFNSSLLIMIAVPLVVDVSYQAWKWPWQVKKELNITIRDVFSTAQIFINKIQK
jgi:O-antigen/teichoic acid export membrane protein